MSRSYCNNSFCPCLIDSRYSVQEKKGKFIVFPCYLDHIAIHGIKGLRNIDSYFILAHTYLINLIEV